MKLSICMMVKNEEKHLEECLESMDKLRDSVSSELIVVDTGSTDSTVEIARKFTDKVYFHPWNNNFSEMRNITISYAKGEWILIIDGDEVFDSTSEIIKFLKSKDSFKFGAATVEVKNLTIEDLTRGYVVLQSPRLFKNDGNFKYEGIVHNIPIYKGESVGLNVLLIHYGYISTDKDLMERKFQRTSTLLKEELKKNPQSIYYRYQLSVSYMMHGDNKESLEEIEKAYKSLMKNRKDINRHLYLYCQLVKAYLTNNKYEDAEKICLEGLKYEEDYIDLYFYLAQSQAKLEKYEAAIKSYRKYIYLVKNYEKLPIRKNMTLNIHTLSNIDEALYNSSVIYYKLEKYKETLECIEKNESSDFVSLEYKIYIEAAVKIKLLKNIKQYYDSKIKDLDNDIKSVFFRKLEDIKIELEEDKLQLITLFSIENSSYGDLNKLRIACLKDDVNIDSMINEFIYKVDFNILDDYYGDILYFMIKKRLNICNLLYDLKPESIDRYFKYLFENYTDFSYELKEYIQDIYTEEFVNLKSKIVLQRCILIMEDNVLNDEEYISIFKDYIGNGYNFIENIYSSFVLNNGLINELKNEEQIFFYYMGNIGNKTDREFVKSLERALEVYPFMKRGIELLLNDFNSKINSKNDEFENYKLKIKSTIKALIDNDKLEEACQIIDEYEQIVKDDLEIVLFKSKISLKKLNQVNTTTSYKM